MKKYLVLATLCIGITGTGQQPSSSNPQSGSPTASGSSASITGAPDISNAVELGKELRKQMRDPDSIVIERVSYWVNDKEKKQEHLRDTEAYCFEYRAKNGYGGYTSGTESWTRRFKKGKLDRNGGWGEGWDCNNFRGTETTLTKQFDQQWANDGQPLTQARPE